MLRVAEHYAGTDTGRQRRANEDSLLARSPLFVVADGMGGAQAGEVASRIAVESFRNGLEDAAEPELALSTLALAANTRIHELSHSNAEQAGMGTTLTAVYVGEREVAIAHVGDSRVYCLRDGELLRLTDDHSLVDELVRQGRLTPEEAIEHPQRSVITRALGPELEVEVDTRSFDGRDGDVYLLCSDGLTTMVEEAQLTALLLAHPRLKDAGEALVAAANEAGGRDNITVVLLRLEDVQAATAPGEAPQAPEHLEAPARSVTEQPPEGSLGGQATMIAPPARTPAPAPPWVGEAPLARVRVARAPGDAPAAPRGARGSADRAGGGRLRALPRVAVGLLHRHQQQRSRDPLPRGSLPAARQRGSVQQRLRLRCQRLNAPFRTAAHAARSLPALRRRRRGVDTQPRTGAARMRPLR